MNNSKLNITFSEFDEDYFDSSVVNFSFSDLDMYSDVLFYGEKDAHIYTITGDIVWSELFSIVLNIVRDFITTYTKKYIDIEISVEGREWHSLSVNYMEYIELYGEPSSSIEELKKISRYNSMELIFNNTSIERIIG